MGAVSLTPSQNLYAQHQQTGQVTKGDLLKTFDANGDGKIGENQSNMGSTGVSELDAAQANLGSLADEIVDLVNDPTIPDDMNLIEDSFENGEFDPVMPAVSFFEAENPLGIPKN